MKTSENTSTILKRTVVIVLLIGLGAAAGYLLGRGGRGSGETAEHDHGVQADAESKEPLWYCSMHPQIVQPKPGFCPICKMTLIEKPQETALGPRQLRLSGAARRLLEIEVYPVERRYAEAEVRMVGAVDFDETRLSYLTAWVGGRLERLYVDYTGIPVRQGDHMVSLYSPELISAQEELRQALRASREIKDSSSGLVRESTAATVAAAREKLKLLGLRPEQIKALETEGTVQETVTIYAPQGGIVIEKHAKEGQYVQTGTRIYTIADLSWVWVKLEAYESDLSWLRYGQAVEFTSLAQPGETFRGTISFIDPVLDEKTRTVKLRVNARNAEGKLKPGMFVKAAVRSRVAAGGKVMDADLRGKWMCPMHPEVVREEGGSCPVCEMPLERTEELGYVGVAAGGEEKPLVIPVSAALQTGTRAVVYVQVADKKEGVIYEGREVRLGPRAGDYYLVRGGLKEGELVVTRGNFKIDSALQIQAKGSMMTGVAAAPALADDERELSEEDKQQLRGRLEGVFAGYFALQRALRSDKVDPEAVGRMAAGLLEAKDLGLPKGTSGTWERRLGVIQKALIELRATEAIQTARGRFSVLSNELIEIVQQIGMPHPQGGYLMTCPMAFDNRGARWLQEEKNILNPYFGNAMLVCGERQAFYPPEKEEP